MIFLFGLILDEEETPSTSKLNNVDKSKQKLKKTPPTTERIVYITKKRGYGRERCYNKRSPSRKRSKIRKRSYSRDR